MKHVSTLALGPVLLGLLLFTTSCKREQDTIPPTTSGTTNGGFVSSFVGVSWQMADFTLDRPVDIDGDGKLDSDLLQFMRPCDLDNTIVFERTGILTGSTGKLNCDDDTDPTTQKPDTWTYDNAANELRIMKGTVQSVSVWKVIEASARLLKVTVTITEDGQSLTAVMTWKRA